MKTVKITKMTAPKISKNGAITMVNFKPKAAPMLRPATAKSGKGISVT